MARTTITREDLIKAIQREIGLSNFEAKAFISQVLEEIGAILERGETVKLHGFGNFVVRQKGRRLGRNPKTGEPVPIRPRRSLMFKPSPILKSRINPPAAVENERGAKDEASSDASTVIASVGNEQNI